MIQKVTPIQAAEVLQRGGLVIIPTETVYGLAADGLSASAVAKIFAAKGRPAKNPLILHVSSQEMLRKIVVNASARAEILMKAFWPGPLTLVFEKNNLVPEIVTAGLKTVCVRMPKHLLTLELIEKFGGPIAAPSANLSGRPSPTSFEAAAADLEVRGVEFGVDGGAAEVGLESTVIDVAGDVPTILRLGGIGVEEIEKVLGEKVKVVDREEKMRSPGQDLKHYSPSGQVILVYPWETFGKNKSPYPTVETAVADLYHQYKTGIICVDERVSLCDGYNVFALGESGNSEIQARNLFQVLLKTEKLGWEKIIVDMTGIGGKSGIGPAILERLKRSAE